MLTLNIKKENIELVSALKDQIVLKFTVNYYIPDMFLEFYNSKHSKVKVLSENLETELVMLDFDLHQVGVGAKIKILGSLK